MTITDLRALARWHDERATRFTAKLHDPANHAELRPLRETIAFHSDTARGLRRLADAFATMAQLQPE